MIQKDFYKEASIAFTGHREIPSEQQNEVKGTAETSRYPCLQAGKIPLFLWHGIGL